MATGSYVLGATVKIPVQVLLDGQPVVGSVPIIDKIIMPNGTSMSGFPSTTSVVDYDKATYSYSLVPDTIGDYIVIIKSTVNSVEYVTIDNFTVSPIIQLRSAPRAEPK